MRVIAKLVLKDDDTKTRTIPIEIESLNIELAKDALRSKDLLIFSNWIVIEIKEIKKFLPMKNKVG